jgi:hypothetical protein
MCSIMDKLAGERGLGPTFSLVKSTLGPSPPRICEKNSTSVSPSPTEDSVTFTFQHCTPLRRPKPAAKTLQTYFDFRKGGLKLAGRSATISLRTGQETHIVTSHVTSMIMTQ